jgi:hypothetical protein
LSFNPKNVAFKATFVVVAYFTVALGLILTPQNYLLKGLFSNIPVNKLPVSFDLM